MADKKVVVEVEITGQNKAGDAVPKDQPRAPAAAPAAAPAESPRAAPQPSRLTPPQPQRLSSTIAEPKDRTFSTSADWRMGETERAAELDELKAEIAEKGARRLGMRPSTMAGMPEPMIRQMATTLGVKTERESLAEEIGKNREAQRAGLTPQVLAGLPGDTLRSLSESLNALQPQSLSQSVSAGVVRGWDATRNFFKTAGTTQGPAWMQTASSGKWGMDKSGLGAVTQGLKQFQVAALAAGAAATAAVAATAPAAWATFTGSIQLLSGRIANMLVPAFAHVSWYLQRGADWVGSWDERTKSLVSTIAVWGGGLLLAGAALSKLGALILPVVKGVGMLAVGVVRAGAALTTFAIANPWAAGLAAAVVTVGALTNGFGLLGNALDRVRQRADAAQERITRLQGGGRVTRSDYDELPINLRVGIESARAANGRTAAQQRQVVLDSMIRHHEATLERLMDAGPTALQTQIEAALNQPRPLGPVDQLRATTDNNFWRDRDRQTIADVLRRNNVADEEARQRAEQAIPGGLWPGAVRGENLRTAAQAASGSIEARETAATLATLRQVRSTGVPGLLPGMSLSMPVQPRTFGGGDQYYGDILQQVLGRDTLAQRNFQQQMDNDMRLLQEVQGLRNDVRQWQPPPR